MGQAPFYHISRKETMKKIINADTNELQFSKKVSQNAVDFIQGLLKKDPKERLNLEQVSAHIFLNGK